MRTSESIGNITKALLKAQKLMGGAAKGASNPYFKSKYADYGAVLEACKDLLNENGIVILQPHREGTNNSFVETLLVHESGEWISSETPVVCAKQNDPQALGSAITYARRYGLQSLLAMPAEDDDGEKAMARPDSKAATTFQAQKAAAPKTQAEPAKVAEAPKPTTPAAKSSFKQPAKTEAKPEAASELDWG